MNIFVHHAMDKQAQIYAALLRDCDAGEGRYRVCVTTEQNVQRFLVRYGVHPQDVELPFLILSTPNGKQRSVLHGHRMHEWLSELVEVYVSSAVVSPERIFRLLVQPHLSPCTVRLLEAMFVAPVAAPPPPPMEKPQTHIVVVQRPSPAVQQPVSPQIQVIEEGMMEDDDGTTTAVTPEKSSTKRREAPGAISSIMQESKAREAMVHRNAYA